MFQSNSTTDEYEHRVQGLQIELNEQYKIIKNL